MEPMPMVMPAVAIDATAMTVVLSMISPLDRLYVFAGAGSCAGAG
jgi:hypothetical protein